MLQIQIKKKENNHWLEFENWPLKIYIQIIKHYTDIDPSVITNWKTHIAHGIQLTGKLLYR